jgi:L-rhamnonate dehydratase
MKIVEVNCHVAPMAASWLSEAVIANPMSGYPEYWEKRSSWFGEMTAAAIELVLDNGIRGYGFVGGGKGRVAAAIVDSHFRSLLIGKGADDHALLYEQIERASIPYGRGGIAQETLSGIDIALWDARGKAMGWPCHRLMGGRRDKIQLHPYYTGYDPEAMAEFGIQNMKMAMPYGPAHGEEGMRKNEDAVARARDFLGEDALLALDIYMAWGVDYTLRMYERLERYQIAWLEEPVLPGDYDGYRDIRRRVNTQVSGGEHEYTYEGFYRLIHDGQVQMIQPDIYRAGGPTALLRLAELAKKAGVRLVCHGVGAPTYHFLSTLDANTAPFVEYVDIYRGTTKEWILTDDPRPVNGVIAIDNKPGFGYTLRPGDAPVATIW